MDDLLSILSDWVYAAIFVVVVVVIYLNTLVDWLEQRGPAGRLVAVIVKVIRWPIKEFVRYLFRKQKEKER